MRFTKTVFLISALAISILETSGCTDKSSGNITNTNDSVTVNINNHIEALMCIYVNSDLFCTAYGGAQGRFMSHKGDTLRARAYQTYTIVNGLVYYDTFNIVNTSNYVCGCIVTLHCNDYDTIAKSDMTWDIGY